jgi:hypothetical protein
VSVAVEAKKGKSSRVKQSGRPLRQGLCVLVALEIPQQQYQEENDGEHEKAEVVALSISTAHW